MRILTRLRLVSAVTLLALGVLVPVLVASLLEFRQAKSDFALADAIKVNFFERASLRDQYFLYREDRLHKQWHKNKAGADDLLRRARLQFERSQDRQTLERLRQDIDTTAVIFRRIVDNTHALQAAGANRLVYEEHDKRLYSQLLLKGSAVRDSAIVLQDAAAFRVEQTYRHLIVVTGLFAVTLALVTLLISNQMRRLIRRRLAPLHQGAEIVAGGDLDFRIPDDGADEFDDLAGSFNAMTERLQTFTRQLEAEIGAHKAAEAQLRELNRDFVSFLENTSDFIYFKDQDSRFRFCSQTLATITGHASWRDMIGKHDLEVFPADTAQIYYKEELPIFRAGQPLLNKEDPYYDAAGNRGWVSTNKWPLLDQDGRVVGLFGISRDITASKQAEEKLQLAASVFTHAREGITITTADGTIIDVNDTFCRITGYSRDEVLGKNPRLLNSGRHDPAFYVALWRDLTVKGHWEGEIWNRRKNGEVYAEMLAISAVRDAQGHTRQYVALFSDITPLKEHESQLERIAHYDALTALPNRVLLADRMNQAMSQVQRRQQRIAVAYLDLDGFKSINDSYGHTTGDQFLIAVAARMKQALREGDTLARLGGDEFVAVLLDLPDAAASVPMLTRLLAAAAQPVQIGDYDVRVSASIGVTFYPQADDVDADQLLRQADQAMYQAKLAGKNRYHLFDSEQDRSVRGHHESLERIRRALADNEFVLYFQPKVNLRSGAVIGAEALIRWQHPDKGLLPPAAFLPVIEDHPLGVAVGEWVIDTALAQLAVWHAAGLDIPVSVNIGARQLQQADFVPRLRAMLAAHAEIQPGQLELEVLETSALEDLARASQVMVDCREIGVRFALDDFGTGYSSLTYLKRLPVTQLKIDQSFVHDMLDDPDDMAILEGVLGLATAFSLQVIAEGVETAAHGEMLLQLGCELAQGYGIARPMPAHELPAWALAWRPDPAWAALRAVSRDDLPTLFAQVEHRAWIDEIGSALRGELVTALPLDAQQCRFGLWLGADGRARYAAHPTFCAVESLHRQMHDLVTELCELHRQERNPQALARLGELHALRDAMSEQLKLLGQKGHAG